MSEVVGPGDDQGGETAKDRDDQATPQAESTAIAAHMAGGQPLDWQAIHTEVLRKLTTFPAPGEDGQARIMSLSAASMPRNEKLHGPVSLRDAVQEAIAEVLSSGQPMPSHDAALEAVLVAARRRWKAWTRRTRERSRNLDLHARNLEFVGTFDVIAARNQHLLVIERLWNALEPAPEARRIIDLVLRKGIRFNETKLLAAEMRAPAQEVTYLKRQIKRAAQKVVAELGGSPGEGGRA
jgi:hypothetical protein